MVAGCLRGSAVRLGCVLRATHRCGRRDGRGRTL